ncbi:hypothetical protein AYO38_10460 [bacterium SCGC AG-212-C10]|nr:hypothetical protein AYO38_10460 [bacterium SCGC AG-212-C10]
MNVSLSRPALWPEIRIVLFAAMVIFLYTIGIGILNGTDLVDFDQRRILGHVHGGTLGWLTLAVYAASLWLFGEQQPVSEKERSVIRAMVGLATVSFPIYVAAFSLTFGVWRPITGVLALAAIVAFTAWVGYRARSMTLGVPHLGFLAALGTSVVGGILGVLLGLDIATDTNWLPDGGEGAHPGTMVVGFLIPVTLAMVEWSFFFPSPPAATRAGKIQMLFPFLGGVVLMVALLLDIVPLAPIAVILEIVGIGIFVKRLWPNFKSVDWKTANPHRYAVLAAVAVVFVIGLAQYLIIRYDGDFDNVPEHLLLALDHTQFIGAVTNSVFALLLAVTMVRGRGNNVDNVVFILVNVGIIGFASGLLADSTIMKRIFAPTMGVGLLIGLGTYAWRLAQERVGGMAPAKGSR